MDYLEDAIEQNKKVIFRYYDLDANGQKVYRRDGHHYVVEPIGLVFNEDNYYLMVYSARHDNTANYRVDRMDHVEIVDEAISEKALTLREGIDSYTEQAFKMYGGQQVDVVLGGDLLNQCIASAYAVRELERPFLGLYGACSTMAESLTLAALLVESGAAEKALAVTSSHFCSSERQFRFPLNYGGVRTPTAQHTATASGAALVGKQGSIHIEEVCIGRVVDLGVTDLNNMGAAMAPAAWDTLRQYFADTGTGPADYDKIITGDLAQVGSDLLVRLAAEEGCDLRPRYTDCGLMLYDREGQKVDAGASGCGCSAAVMCAHFLPAMQRGEYKNILFMATGALMSPTACQQGESIPGVAHLLHLTAAGEPLS